MQRVILTFGVCYLPLTVSAICPIVKNRLFH
jgi:hypothetical protein